jgi:hypothetical protein
VRPNLAQRGAFGDNAAAERVAVDVEKLEVRQPFV